MVNQVLQCVALAIVNLFRVKLFDVVAYIVVHVAQWFYYWDVHFFDSIHGLCQCYQIFSGVL